MTRRPDHEEGGVLMDDYPRIQRQQSAVVDPENTRRPPMRRLPKLKWRRWVPFAAIAVVAAVLGWCLHPADTGDAVRTAAALEAKALSAELATATTALAAEKQAAAARVTEQERLAAASAATVAAIADKLAAAVGEHGEVTPGPDEVRVSIPDKLLFRPGEADLTAAGLEVLSSLGTALNDKDVVERLIWVEGHTDDTPLAGPKPARPGPRGRRPAPPPVAEVRFTSNWQLSSARAVAVAEYLADQVKVDPQRIGAAGFGSNRPVSKTKAKNRRIVLVLAAPPSAPPAPPAPPP